MKKHLKDFLKNHTIDDIKKEVIGELDEYSNDDYSSFFGNGELILCCNSTGDETVYVIDTIGFNEYLIEY